LLIAGFGTVFWLDYRARVGTKQPNVDQLNAVGIHNALQGLFERVGHIERLPRPATAEDHSKLVTTVVNLATETNARVDRLAPNPNSERDLLVLINYALYQSSLLMLGDLLDAAPEDMGRGPLQLGGDFSLKNDLSNNFIDLVRRKLDPGSFRRMDFENIMRHAEVNAEMQLENTPMDHRPKGVDPLLLRRWAISHLQCVSAIEFLERQRNEVREKLLNQRPQLLEQYRLRNPN
jgi:hypothetical protein